MMTAPYKNLERLKEYNNSNFKINNLMSTCFSNVKFLLASHQ